MNSSNMDMFHNFASMEAFNTNNGTIMPLSHEGFTDLHQQQQQQPQLSIENFDDVVQRSIGPNGPVYDPLAHFLPLNHGCNTTNMISSEPEILLNSSSPISGIGLAGTSKDTKQHQNYGGRKRKRVGERSEIEKPREVVHVRAKRGQATDSHSLAERLRREKINEKLRCLQDLVPGCYKTMGMAVMLDVIINYVRSLQNQIDFLSMKLSAASLFYDFNSLEAEAIEAIQQGNTSYEVQGMEKLVGEGNGGIPQFQTPWPL